MMDILAATNALLIASELKKITPLPPDLTTIQAPPRTAKLARSGMIAYKHKLHKEQDGLCPLCLKQIDLTEKGEGVIDHCHDTGRIRGLLHRSCNAAEGKIANGAGRWGCKSMSYTLILPYLKNLVAYLEREPKNLIYPMHKDADEKADIRRAKAREQRAAIAARKKLALANNKEKHGN